MRLQELLEDINRRGFIGGTAATLGLGAADAGAANTAQANKPIPPTKNQPPPGHWAMQAYPQSYYVPISDRIEGWRANEKTGQGIETMPAYFHLPWIRSALSAYSRGYPILVEKFPGLLKHTKKLTAEEFLALMLTEGRSDFGYNEETDTHGVWGRMFEALKPLNLNPAWAGFVVHIAATKVRMERLNQSFYNAWQGSPRFNARYDLNLTAARHPKNAALLKLFKQYVP